MGVNPASIRVSDGELLKCQLQQHRVVLEEIEAGARDLAAGLEVDQVEGFAELDMVLDRKIESAWSAYLAELAAVVFGHPNRSVRDVSGWERAAAAA